MNNPRCLHASCGDCFFSLRSAFCVSLALHMLVVALIALEQTQHSSGGSDRMLVTLLREERQRMPVISAAADSPSVEGSLAQTKLAQLPENLRSTPEKPGKRKSAEQHQVSSEDESTVLPEGADVSAYRLALGRSTSRLIAAARMRALVPGEIVFVLQGEPGQVHPQLFLSPQSSAMISAESLLSVMRLAVEQTPLPPGWGGRRFRLSLRLQVLPNQSVAGSG